MSTLFFTSDLHLGHVRCATAFRGFASVDAHNATIVDNWNSVVGDDDIVYVLGDLCMGTIADSLAVAATLKGHKFLVPGNHDRVHPAYHHKGDSAAKRQAWKAKYAEAGFMTMARTLTFDNVGGVTAIACHFPFNDDHEQYADEPRYPEYRPTDDGSVRLLHGHIHDMRRESADGRQVNVGVDVWDFAPVSLDEIVRTVGW